MKKLSWVLGCVAVSYILLAAGKSSPSNEAQSQSGSSPRAEINTAPLFKHLRQAIRASALDDVEVSKLLPAASTVESSLQAGPSGSEAATKSLNEIAVALKRELAKSLGNAQTNPATALRVRSLFDVMDAVSLIAGAFNLKPEDLPPVEEDMRCQHRARICVPRPRERCMQMKEGCVSVR